ncbi:Fc.00g022160.m01.CDS01 [Cosmosporella sp. VM-42]
MKVTFTAILLTALAGSGLASPMGLNEREESGLFDFLGVGGQRGGNFFSDIFDNAACVVSGFIGGGNPRCSGRGTLEGAFSLGGNSGANINANGNAGGDAKTDVNFNSNANSNSYSFSYTTDGNGKLKITITPDAQGKNPCTTTVDTKSGDDIRQLVKEAADKCL